MTLKELIDKLEAARVLLGDEARVTVNWIRESSPTYPPAIDKVWVSTDRVYLDFQMTGR